jgi:hypothetical protein
MLEREIFFIERHSRLDTVLQDGGSSVGISGPSDFKATCEYTLLTAKEQTNELTMPKESPSSECWTCVRARTEHVNKLY